MGAPSTIPSYGKTTTNVIKNVFLQHATWLAVMKQYRFLSQCLETKGETSLKHEANPRRITLSSRHRL